MQQKDGDKVQVSQLQILESKARKLKQKKASLDVFNSAGLGDLFTQPIQSEDLPLTQQTPMPQEELTPMGGDPPLPDSGTGLRGMHLLLIFLFHANMFHALETPVVVPLGPIFYFTKRKY